MEARRSTLVARGRAPAAYCLAKDRTAHKKVKSMSCIHVSPRHQSSHLRAHLLSRNLCLQEAPYSALHPLLCRLGHVHFKPA